MAGLVGLVLGGLLVVLIQTVRGRARRASDAGERRSADARLMSLSELTGQLAHEIRNPLSTLKVNLKLLQEDWESPGADAADVRRRSVNKLGVLNIEADRLERILDDFLRFVGRGELELQPCDANQLVEELVQFFGPQSHAAGVKMRPSLSPGPLLIRADPRLLKQAMLNLLINAQQSMPQGGEIIVRTRRIDANRAQIEFADTGPGIPQDARERIFDAFYSTKKDGTGLGLTTTRRIISDHRGQISVHSAAGTGTSFTITLPLARSD